jgi:hypothetical protein
MKEQEIQLFPLNQENENNEINAMNFMANPADIFPEGNVIIIVIIIDYYHY